MQCTLGSHYTCSFAFFIACFSYRVLGNMQITIWFYYLRELQPPLLKIKVIVATIVLPLHREGLSLQRNAFSIDGFCWISKTPA